MGRERAAAATSVGGMLAVACDVDHSRAAALAAAHPGAIVASHSDMLDWSRLDAVFVCTPPFARGGAEVEAIRAGVPLFLEKPIGVTVDDALPLLDALANCDVINAVGYMNRYRRSVDAARLIATAEGVLGVSAYWVSGTKCVEWREREELSGGGINDEATHVVDLIRYLVGEVVAVQAWRHTPSGSRGVSGSMAVLLRLQAGIPGTMFYSGGSAVKQINISVHTPKRELRLTSWDFDLIDGTRRVAGRGRGTERSAIFVREVEAFVTAIRDSNPSLIRSTVADAMRTQRVIDLIRESAGDDRLAEVDRAPTFVNV
jgi:predicted dehydrogenase